MDEKISLRDFGIKCEDEEAFSAAVIALRALLKGDPTDSFAWMTLGNAYKVLSRFGDARSAMDQALIHASDERRWMVMTRRAAVEEKSGHHEECEAWYERAFAEPDFSESRWPHVLRGANLLRLERFADAERLFRNATELASEYDEDDNNEAWHMLGVSLLAQERLEEAAEAFQRALEVNPESDISRKQLDGLKQVEVVRKMIADDSLPKVDRLV
ncbi:MAG: tetratricopeptide repeat protein [Pirellulaceae bacterium]|nr:tetratricopeptide repeat protein [Pirellulaceae bacterium]